MHHKHLAPVAPFAALSTVTLPKLLHLQRLPPPTPGNNSKYLPGVSTGVGIKEAKVELKGLPPQSNDAFLPPLHPLSPPIHHPIPVAGRIQEFLPLWEAVTLDWWVLDILKGYY